ncbi:hypothetical protein PMAYCL1PPCAC_27207, partial [Pristionchus mayeri]
MQSLFPYQSSYRVQSPPGSWDRYYPAQEPAGMLGHSNPETPSVSSGLAAGITITIFFLVFIFTFGCRIYSEYVDRAGQGSARSRSD